MEEGSEVVRILRQVRQHERVLGGLDKVRAALGAALTDVLQNYISSLVHQGEVLRRFGESSLQFVRCIWKQEKVQVDKKNRGNDESGREEWTNREWRLE